MMMMSSNYNWSQTNVAHIRSKLDKKQLNMHMYMYLNSAMHPLTCLLQWEQKYDTVKLPCKQKSFRCGYNIALHA